MKRYAILTYMASGMVYGTAPAKEMPARLNEGYYNSPHCVRPPQISKI